MFDLRGLKRKSNIVGFPTDQENTTVVLVSIDYISHSFLRTTFQIGTFHIFSWYKRHFLSSDKSASFQTTMVLKLISSIFLVSMVVFKLQVIHCQKDNLIIGLVDRAFTLFLEAKAIVYPFTMEGTRLFYRN